MKPRYEVEFLKKLVKMNTSVLTKSNYVEICEMIASEFKRMGVEAMVAGEKVPYVKARINAGADKDLAIVSHYDVVPAEGPWKVGEREFNPFNPLEVEGKLYGRGVADNKSGIAITLGTFREIRNDTLKYNPIALIVGDEEVGGIGIREVLDSGFRCDAAVILDARAGYVEIGASGVVHGWIRVHGKGGHAGYPHLCNNPIWGLSSLVTELKLFSSTRASKLLDVPSPPGSPVPKIWGRFSITILKAGSNHNVIPDMAEAGFDLRIIPGEQVDEALNELYSFFNSARERYDFKAELTVDKDSINTGWLIKPDHHLVQEARKAADAAYDFVYGEEKATVFSGVAVGLGGDDGYYFVNKGIPTVGFGTMRPNNNIHGRNEFVYIKDLALVREFVIRMLRPA